MSPLWLARARRWILFGMALSSLVLGIAALHVRIDSGFLKLLPLKHPYVQAFFEEQSRSPSGNQVFVALVREDGDIFDARFLELLRDVTQEVAAIPGVDRARVTSLFTPNVKYTELVESGFVQDVVVPANFSGTLEQIEQVRRNVRRSGLAARLVSPDRHGTMITAELIEVDPTTHQRLDYVQLARRLESDIRSRHESPALRIHILGFAKLIGEIVDGLWVVLLFLGLTLAVSFAVLWASSRSVMLALLPLCAGFLSVVWQLGAITLAGLGIDPLSILICFLTFAVATSHGVQVMTGIRHELDQGAEWLLAADRTVKALWRPATLACATDFVGFGALLFIPIGILRDVAWCAILGESALLLIVLLGLPAVLSYLRTPPPQAAAPGAPRAIAFLARFAERRTAASVLVFALLGAGVSLFIGEPEVGDLQPGAPELRQSSRYNRDVAAVGQRFAMGTDLLTIFARGQPDACLTYDAMEQMDRLDFALRQLPEVKGVVALPRLAKSAFVAWNEGNLKWFGLPGTQEGLAVAMSGFEPSMGLLNHDCSRMTLMVFTRDHLGITIRRVIGAIQAFTRSAGPGPLELRLGGGNVGLMAASNETLGAAQNPMRAGVFACIILLVLLWLRSWRAVIVIVGPLALVALGTNALMARLEIGLSIATAPVFALGAGLGVDFSIYVYSQLERATRAGQTLPQAYRSMLETTGRAVLLTGVMLATSLGVWAFSPLKLQSEMGLLLALVLVANVVGALVLLPSLAAFLLPPRGTTGASHPY